VFDGEKCLPERKYYFTRASCHGDNDTMLILSPSVTAASSQGKSAVCYAADILDVPSSEKLMFVEAVSRVIVYCYAQRPCKRSTLTGHVLQKMTHLIFLPISRHDWINL